MPCGGEHRLLMPSKIESRILVVCLQLFAVWTVLEARPPFPLESFRSTRKRESTIHQFGIDKDVFTAEAHGGLFTLQDGAEFAKRVRSHNVVDLVKGCGREPNRLVVFDDGSKACCRYRDLEWRELRGDIYSYHFNNMLGLHNSPPAVAVQVKYRSAQWEQVTEALREAKWRDHKVVVMTKFVEEIIPEAIPSAFRKDDHVVDQNDLISSDDRERLLQWSDMIVFDFIIGHSDRIFNTLLNLQWFSKMMDRNVHNLWKTKQDKRFLLIDNESGLWMGYKLGWCDEQKLEMQSRYLEKLCLFRNSTVDRIRSLIYGNEESPRSQLEAYIKSVDPQSFAMFKTLSRKEGQEFELRLKKVENQINKCTTS